jgi:hypothetical protein
MMWLALVLAVITGRTELLNETIRVPHSQWRALKVELKQRPATVEVEYEVLSGRSGVRVVFLTNEDAERFEKGQSYTALKDTEYESKGKFQYLVGNPGEYRILIDNRLEGREPAETKVKISLLYDKYDSFLPKTLDPVKRRWIAIGSLAGFGLVALVVGRKLVPTLRG